MNTDFDAFSSMVAAKMLYPEGRFVFPGAQEKKLRDFIDDMYPIEQIRIKDIDPNELKRVIIVDTKSPSRLGPIADIIAASKAEIHIYDHHEHEPGDLSGTLEVISTVGATATLITEVLRERGIKKPLPIEASILCMGIYEETGNMLYPNTTDRDLEAAAWLLRAGASLRIVSTYIKSALSADEINLLNKLTHASRELVINGLKVVVASAISEKYLGDAAHLAHRVMDIGYTEAAIILLDMEGKILLVGRSRTPEINVAKVMAQFGGGGHPTAASATVTEAPLSLVEEQVIQEIKNAIRPGIFAQDVMTSPVITINKGMNINEAEAMMTRYSINVLPVVDGDNTYIGIISRELVEKAIFHRLSNGLVEDFATTDAITAVRYTPVHEIEGDMIEQNQRFVPVLDDDKVIGAITRTDLLRAMYDANLRRMGISKSYPNDRQSIEKNIESWICARLPEGLCEMLKLAGETALRMGFNAYLVGGSVRDIIRSREKGATIAHPDIDIVIEGNGVAFAREFGSLIGARVHVHERFHTATMVTDNLKLDIATARTEYYESPGALPMVEMSSIKKDLYRRDFTINTLAVKLTPNTFGRLVDFFGAQRDIKERTIKVLHNLSFIEDPTRAFRAVRFAERFGFRISRHTEGLIRTALRMELFDKLTGTRLYDEMRLIFNENEPLRTIARLDHYGLLKVIHPALALNAEMEEMLASVDATLSWFGLLFTNETPHRAVIYLSAMLSPMKDKEKQKALSRLTVPMKIRRTIMNSIALARKAIRKMPPDDPALICEALSPLSLESILLAMALTKHEDRKKAISKYLLEYRNIKPELRGEDLKQLGLTPGPVFSRLLNELLSQKLRGELASREDEIEYVRAKIATGKI